MSIQWNQQQSKTFENEFIAKDHQIMIIIDQIPKKWTNYKIFELKYGNTKLIEMQNQSEPI